MQPDYGLDTAWEDLLPDAEIWTSPERLSADECLDEIGVDWRSTTGGFSEEGDEI